MQKNKARERNLEAGAGDARALLLKVWSVTPQRHHLGKRPDPMNENL